MDVYRSRGKVNPSSPDLYFAISTTDSPSVRGYSADDLLWKIIPTYARNSENIVGFLLENKQGGYLDIAARTSTQAVPILVSPDHIAARSKNDILWEFAPQDSGSIQLKSVVLDTQLITTNQSLTPVVDPDAMHFLLASSRVSRNSDWHTRVDEEYE